MATLNDITVPNDSWVSAYALTGISVGSALVIQSKGDYLLSKCVTSQPSSDDTNGVVVVPLALHIVTSGETGCWLKATTKPSPVNVQQGI